MTHKLFLLNVRSRSLLIAVWLAAWLPINALYATPPSLWTRQTGEDWPGFLGPRGDGSSAEKGVDASLWKPHPALKWTLPLGVSYGGPTISGGRLFQFDRFGISERLSCFNAETGKELWRWASRVEYEDQYGYNNGPRCSAIVADEHVYTYGVTGVLACLQVVDGKEVWKKDVSSLYGVVPNFFGVASTPYVYKNLLLVMVGGSPQSSRNLPSNLLSQVKPNGSAMVAFNRLTGKEVYRCGDELASYAAITVREIEGKPTGLAFLRGGLIGFDPDTGKQLFQYAWRASINESVNAALPVTKGNQLLISEAYEIGSSLLAVESGQPKVVWSDSGTNLRRHAFRAHWSTPVWVGDFLYGCSGRNQPDSDFRCIRMRDGAVQWSDRRHERSSVLLVDGHLIVLGEYGRLELVRATPDKLEVLAEAEMDKIPDPGDKQPLLSYPCWAAPVLAHGLLYVRGNDRLVCMELIQESR
jgi:outer membrane protein assembly factor BamB